MADAMMMAQVVMTPDRMMTATLNPGLPEEEKLWLACKCAEMFAKMAGDMSAVMGDGAPKKPQILVPKAGFQL